MPETHEVTDEAIQDATVAAEAAPADASGKPAAQKEDAHVRRASLSKRVRGDSQLSPAGAASDDSSLLRRSSHD